MNFDSLALPLGIKLRPATASDIGAIRLMVLWAKLDPTQLRWTQFWVMETENEIIACGQLRQFEQAQELGSVIVKEKWRNQGLGSYMVKFLSQKATYPLYLECLGDKLASFYHRLGFVAVSWENLPPSLKGKFRLSHWGVKLLKLPVHFLKYER